MKSTLRIAAFVCALAVACFGQTTTPNISLALPSQGALNWNVQLNNNFNALDSLLGGGTAMPAGFWNAAHVAFINGVQQQAYSYGADTGTANAYAVTLTPAPTLVAGSSVVFKAANANTGSSTLAVNGASATTIYKQGGTTALVSGDIVSGQMVRVTFDGLYFQMQSQPASSGGTWGSITGTLSSQTDLQTALNGKAASNAGTTVNGTACTLGASCAPYGGVALYTASHTISSSDIGKLVVMNCSSACTLTFGASPAATDWFGVESTGSSAATLSLNGKTYNGASSVPVLNSYRDLRVGSDGSNYFGDAPLVAGTNVTFTPASNGVTVASSGGGGSVNVNGSGVSSPNFNSTSPAADAGYMLAKFKAVSSNVIAEVATTYKLMDPKYGAVADNSTDNCTAITAFNADINSYSGPGAVEADTSLPAGGSAWKSSCGFAFTPRTYWHGGTYCYTGTGDEADIGRPGMSAFPSDQQEFVVKDVHFATGCGTSAAKGVYVEPYVTQVLFENNVWDNHGSSSNWNVYLGSPLNAAYLYENMWWENDSTGGRNAVYDNDTSGLGSNTIFALGNEWAAASLPSTFLTPPPSPCGGTAVFLGASHSKLLMNSFFGWNKNVQVSNANNAWGVTFAFNAFDTGDCSSGGVNSNIQLGDGHTGGVDSVMMAFNDVCRGTLFDQTAGGTVTGMTDSTISQNSLAPACYTNDSTSTKYITSFSGTHTGSSIFANTGFTNVPVWDPPQGLSVGATNVLSSIPLASASDTGTHSNTTALSTLGTWTGVHVDGTYVLGELGISSNTFAPAVSGSGRADYYSASTFPSNQFAQATISTLGGNGAGVLTNVQVGATTYYSFTTSSVTDYLIRMSAGVQTVLRSAAHSSNCSAGTSINLTNTNGSLVGSCGGVSVLTTTDTNITGGYPGLSAYGGASGNGALTNFTAGGFVTITANSGAPTSTCSSANYGSLYLRNDGTTGASLYTCTPDGWIAANQRDRKPLISASLPAASFGTSVQFGIASMTTAQTADALTLIGIGTETCSTPPTVQVLDCGAAGGTCASPTAVASLQMSGTANTSATSTTMTSASIAAGHELRFNVSAGTCSAAPSIYAALSGYSQ